VVSAFFFNQALFGFIRSNGLRIDPAGECVFVTATSTPYGRGAIFYRARRRLQAQGIASCHAWSGCAMQQAQAAARPFFMGKKN